MKAGVFTILGRADSSAVARVMWTVGELGLPHRRLDLGGKFGGLDDPAHRALNPGGRIPTLVTPGGEALWESNAIIRYLTCTYARGAMWPEEPLARAEAEAWMDWSSTFGGAVGRMRTTYRAAGATVESCRSTVFGELPAVRILEQRLEGRRFVVDDSLSIADLSLGVMAHRYARIPDALELPATPNISSWLDRLRDRQAFQDHVVKAVTVRAHKIGG
ncbi:MAG: glutathione S-transferase family protein [Hyphomonadaceae bacterium]|nr:MAG: glutathione S-transferase domain-containing protein [Caulobacteraceae bacterium]MBT9445643.1 glutathione S-transferase family protein [Hyphomonadaceae bacterium]